MKEYLQITNLKITLYSSTKYLSILVKNTNIIEV